LLVEASRDNVTVKMAGDRGNFMNKKTYKRNIFIAILICILIIPLWITSMQPILFRRNFISNAVNINIPRSVKIVDFSHSADLFYAKIQISEIIYNEWKKSFEFYQISEIEDMIERVNLNFIQETLNLENVEEILFKEQFASHYPWYTFAATTRWTVAFITNEGFGEYYLYVMYG